jgi:hypothetical protein
VTGETNTMSGSCAQAPGRHNGFAPTLELAGECRRLPGERAAVIFSLIETARLCKSIRAWQSVR